MNGRCYDPNIGRFLSPDNYVQMPDFTQNFNRYAYCLNNPMKYTDPSGEVIFTILSAVFCPVLLPVAIGADIGWMTGGIRGANTEGMTFWDGAWRGGLVGAVGGGLSMIGGGTFIANVAWGMGQGAITGGLDAALWGNDIGKGMLYGAAAGGAFAAATSGIEAYGNYKDGHGFRTNEGVIKNYLGNSQYDKAVGFVANEYGLTTDFQGRTITYKYNASLKTYGDANMITNQVRIGQAGVTSPSALKATMVHEYGHLLRDRILDGSGNLVGLNYPPYSYKPHSKVMTNPKNVDLYNALTKDGPIGYSQEVYNAGGMHIKTSFLKYYNPLYHESSWSMRYFVPRRYGYQAIAKWY